MRNIKEGQEDKNGGVAMWYGEIHEMKTIFYTPTTQFPNK